MQVEQLTLYVDGYFTNTWDASCFVVMTEKQLEFTTARALLRDGQGVPPALTEHTSIARVPALQHGDFWLTESQAIVEYLEDTFPALPVLPADPRARARARQIMMWLRSDLLVLRAERPWQNMVYHRSELAPLSPKAAHEASELVELVTRLAARGELASWNLAHTDLAFALMRLAADPLPDPARALLADALARPAIRAYVDHPRPPNPPPYVRS